MVARFRCRHSTNLVKYGPYHFHLEQTMYIVRMETEEYSKSDSVSISIHVLSVSTENNNQTYFQTTWLLGYIIIKSTRVINKFHNIPKNTSDEKPTGVCS